MRGLLLALLLLGACGKDPPPASPKPCRSDADCVAPQVCYAHECADPRIGSSNQVTPDKVKREVEGKLEDEHKRVDEALKKIEE